MPVISIGKERELVATGQPACLRIHAWVVRQLSQILAVRIRNPDVYAHRRAPPVDGDLRTVRRKPRQTVARARVRNKSRGRTNVALSSRCDSPKITRRSLDTVQDSFTI